MKARFINESLSNNMQVNLVCDKLNEIGYNCTVLDDDYAEDIAILDIEGLDNYTVTFYSPSEGGRQDTGECWNITNLRTGDVIFETVPTTKILPILINLIRKSQ